MGEALELSLTSSVDAGSSDPFFHRHSTRRAWSCGHECGGVGGGTEGRAGWRCCVHTH